MRYIRTPDHERADRVLRAHLGRDTSAVGNIDKSGSVLGMQRLYRWPKGGQVRIGGYIYNVGPDAVAVLRNANLVRGE